MIRLGVTLLLCGLGLLFGALGIVAFMWGQQQLYPYQPLQCPPNSYVYARWDTTARLIYHCFADGMANEGT